VIRVSLPNAAEAPQQNGVALDSGVWFRFVTQKDEQVRPSHAALHGTVWRLDDPDAPVPPLDYGCRCGIEYVADPNSPAADVLTKADAELTTPAEAFSTYLDKELPAWEKYAAKVKGVHREDYVNELALEIQRAEGGSLSDARDLAEMVARVKLS
jgi:uncharacterized protein with gpF-like domain